MFHGDIRLGDTIDIKFTTRQISGAPFTLAGTPVISAYPANSTTQLTAGITLTVDFDSVTGLNNVRVVASSGNGYLTATNYVLVITTGTVNSVSVVGECIGSFSIENRSAVMPTTAARTLDVSATGEAGVDWANVGSPTTAVALTATTVLLDAASKPGIRKNTALSNFAFLMTDSTNHNPATGLTVTVTRSIDGGAFAAGTLSAVTAVSNGIYRVDFGAGDLNGNVVTLRASATGADDLFLTIATNP